MATLTSLLTERERKEVQKNRLKFTQIHKQTACLEDREARLTKVVKSPTLLLIYEPSSENLHSQKCENENEENEKDQECIDGGDGINETFD